LKTKLNGMGSGFFVTPTFVVTNSHVVEGSDSYVVVLSDGRRTSAKVIADGLGRATGRDFAVLETDKSISMQPIIFTTQYSPLINVYAYGFPYVAIRDDPMWKAILNGDTRTMPNVVVSNGVIERISDNDRNLEVLTHSAKLDGGNSGGALIDACGRVVGINTYIKLNDVDILTADGKARGKALVEAGYYFAVSARELVKFLESRKIKASLSKAKCE
jgi:serine protease Do